MFEKIQEFFTNAKGKDSKPDAKSFIHNCTSNFKEIFSQLTVHERTIFISILVLSVIFIPLASGYVKLFIMAAYDDSFSITTAMSQSALRYIAVGWTYALPATLGVLLIIFMIVAMFVIMRSPDLSPIAEIDENGVAYAKDGTYGTARWLSREEAAKVYEIGDIKDATGYILGQFDYRGDGTKSCISLPTNSSGNQNYLIIGSPGKGKTFSFGFNAVLQAIVRNESIVIVDPKGELCEKLFDVCLEHGYQAKVYNLVDPTHSNAWNFASEIFNPNTGNLDQNRLQAFVNIIMTNTTEGDKEDPFWGAGERNLFTAATAYLGWKHEMTYGENLRRASEDWEGISLNHMSDEDRQRTFDIIQNPKSTIRDIEIALGTVMRASGLVSEKEIEDYLREIREDSDPVTIDRIFAIFVNNDLDALLTMFDQANIPLSHPAAITWRIFKNGDKKIQPNFIQGLTQRLIIFANPDINSMSAHDDINFRELGEKKTAIFCVISASDTSRKLLSSLFFSFLFRDVAEAADELGPENRIPVNVMCDEFANIGRIPDFDRFISTVRSRKIYISIIIQSIAQLATVYDENLQETIIECCDTLLFLGCNGPETAQFISELSGTASIIVSSVKDNKNVTGLRGVVQGYSTSDGAGKRYLINPDEAKTMDPEEVLIYHAGMNMLKAYRCGYIWHPYAKQLKGKQRKLVTFPTVTEMYGEYTDIFAGVSLQTLNNQKVRNEVIARLKAAGYEDDKKVRKREEKPAFTPPVVPIASSMQHAEEPAKPTQANSSSAPKEVHPAPSSGTAATTPSEFHSNGLADAFGVTSVPTTPAEGKAPQTSEKPPEKPQKPVSKPVSEKSATQRVPFNPYASEEIQAPRQKKKKKKKHPENTVIQRANTDKKIFF